MPTPEIGMEAGKAVGYTGLGMLLLKFADLALKKVEHYRAAHSSEVDETWKNASQIREELRKDMERERVEKEKLRDRLDEAERRIDTLEDELHVVRAENEKLRTELERVETVMRIPK